MVPSTNKGDEVIRGIRQGGEALVLKLIADVFEARADACNIAAHSGSTIPAHHEAHRDVWRSASSYVRIISERLGNAGAT